MNWKRVGHLLAFELKRIKWLIAAAWVFLVFAFAPRISDALGRSDKYEYLDADPLSSLGVVGFGIVGLFLAIWSGLVGRKLFPGRPVLAGEARVVSMGVLMGVLVVPVLGLTSFSLWLYGFSSEVIFRNIGGTALATIPLWLGMRLFAMYAGSLRIVMMGIGVVLCFVFLAESFELRGFGRPWINFTGSWLGGERWVATLVAGMTMGLFWFLVKGWSVVPRMAVAILSVVTGWAAMSLAKERRKGVFYSEAISVGIEVTGNEPGWWRAGKASLICEQSGECGDEIIIWEVDGALTDEQGRRYTNAEVGSTGKFGEKLRGPEKKLISQSLLNDGEIYLNGWDQSSATDHVIWAEKTRRILVSLPKDFTPNEKVHLSGRLSGRRYRVETLVEDLTYGEGVVFRKDDLIGSLRQLVPAYSGDTPPLKLRVREPLLDEYSADGGAGSRDQNWIYHLHFPKAGVVVEGRSGRIWSDTRIGGVVRWVTRPNFDSPRLRSLGIKDEVPLISVYRVVVEDGGFVDVESEPFGPIEFGRRRGPSEPLQTRARFERGPPTSDHWDERPDPDEASRAKVGGWLRELKGKRYGGKNYDLAQFAGKWGELFLKSAEDASRFDLDPFVNGATNEWRDEAIETLGKGNAIPWVLIERGWEEESRDRVRTLIAEGNRETEILRFGILLGLEGIEEAVIEGLLRSDSWPLYEAARTRLNIDARLEGILDERLARVEEMTRRSWMRNRLDYHFYSGSWSWLLNEGREKDLTRCLSWIRKAHAHGNYFDGENDYQKSKRFKSLLLGPKKLKELGKAGKLYPENFLWDPVLRRWIFDEKGETR